MTITAVCQGTVTPHAAARIEDEHDAKKGALPRGDLSFSLLDISSRRLRNIYCLVPHLPISFPVHYAHFSILVLDNQVVSRSSAQGSLASTCPCLALFHPIFC